jgi:hypothetical protein
MPTVPIGSVCTQFEFEHSGTIGGMINENVGPVGKNPEVRSYVGQ